MLWSSLEQLKQRLEIMRAVHSSTRDPSAGPGFLYDLIPAHYYTLYCLSRLAARAEPPVIPAFLGLR